ncbi:E3 ubiquitin-protein ligase RNF135 [Leptonychotes weddellii]|uniref:E3 ubiquitin-protein ligase RNF135 n=1 Tax=Leptonychotes weddellii TaxID=9713 RepID=A0A2U3Y5V6_LEPWE|nr:E3 ubiquitin-protein ligase RNF135 [Leptonychotes weddellii]
MAGLDPGPGVPVWLVEDDLGCIICQGLLATPATLPCGHSFCRECLKGLWAAGSASPPRSCPTCRESAPAPLKLRKNTLLQELVDKYSRALREAAAQKSIPEVGRELAELVEQLVDIVRSLQSQRHLPESRPDNEGSTPSMCMSPAFQTFQLIGMPKLYMPAHMYNTMKALSLLMLLEKSLRINTIISW